MVTALENRAGIADLRRQDVNGNGRDDCDKGKERQEESLEETHDDV
jgi:hypothetical protein